MSIRTTAWTCVVEKPQKSSGEGCYLEGRHRSEERAFSLASAPTRQPLFEHQHLDDCRSDGEVAAPLHDAPPRRLHGHRRRALCRQLLPGGAARRESPPRRLNGGCRRTLALEGELCAEPAGRCLNLCSETDTIVQSHSINASSPNQPEPKVQA